MVNRLLSICTVHHTTNRFSSGVFNSPIQDLPNQFYLWEFSGMIDSFRSQVTNQESLPLHSQVIASISINIVKED
jgi:hypothetical protein